MLKVTRVVGFWLGAVGSWVLGLGSCLLSPVSFFSFLISHFSFLYPAKAFFISTLELCKLCYFATFKRYLQKRHLELPYC